MKNIIIFLTSCAFCANADSLTASSSFEPSNPKHTSSTSKFKSASSFLNKGVNFLKKASKSISHVAHSGESSKRHESTVGSKSKMSLKQKKTERIKDAASLVLDAGSEAKIMEAVASAAMSKLNTWTCSELLSPAIISAMGEMWRGFASYVQVLGEYKPWWQRGAQLLYEHFSFDSKHFYISKLISNVQVFKFLSFQILSICFKQDVGVRTDHSSLSRILSVLTFRGNTATKYESIVFSRFDSRCGYDFFWGSRGRSRRADSFCVRR